MKYELIRLFRDRYVQILSLVLFIGGLILFHAFLTDSTYGYSYQQIGMKYAKQTDIEAEIEELENRNPGNMEKSEAYVTGYLSLEKRLDQHILERNEQSAGYQQWREQFLKENEIKIKSGLFGDENSFDIKTLKKANDVYGKLGYIKTETGFWGLEAVFKYRLNDLFPFLLAVLLSLKLIQDDRSTNMEVLQKSTVNGNRLVFQKLYAVLSAVLLFTLFFYLTECAAVCIVLPAGSLNAAIQSVHGFREVPFYASVLFFLFLFLLLKLLWTADVTVLVFTVIYLSDRLMQTVAAAMAILLIQLLLAKSSFMWLRCLSLIRLCDSADLLSRLMYLNVFGLPVRMIAISIAYMVLLLLLCVPVLHISRQPVISSKTVRSCRHKTYPVTLWGIERRKLLLHSGGMVFACLLMLLQIFRVLNTGISLSAEEYAYRNHSMVLQGDKEASKDAYIHEQRETFAYWRSLVESYAADGHLSEDVLNQLIAEAQNHLNGETAFERAASKYEALGEGESYIYETGYEELYGTGGRKQDELSAALLMLVIVSVIAVNESRENESGVHRQIAISPNRERVRRIKTVQYALYAGLLIIPVFLPYLLKIHRGFGLYGLLFPAKSLHMFPEWTDHLNILTVLIMTFLIRMVLAAAASVTFSKLIKKSGNLSASFAAGLILFVAPLVIAYLAG